MQYHQVPPPADLAAIVRSFWFLEGRTPTAKAFSYRLMADSCPEITFQYANHWRSYTDGRPGELTPISTIQGQTVEYKDLCVQGTFGIFGICFYPHIFGWLFRTSAEVFTNHTTDIASFLGREGSEWEEQMMAARDNEDRVRIAVRYIRNKCRSARPADALIVHCLRMIWKHGGRLRIDDLTKGIDISSRQVERRFKQNVGIPPKLLTRLVRFQQALKHGNTSTRWRLTDLAYRLGYADQSHFIREFKSFSGMPPKAYFRITDDVADSFLRMPGQ